MSGAFPVVRLPAVQRDAASADFFDASARGELMIQRCVDSGLALGPEVRTCPESGSVELEPMAASGEGTLVSWVVVHQAPVPALADAVPYLSAVVELAEGPWLLVRLVGLVGTEQAELRSGLPVRAHFVVSGTDEEPGETLPVFEPVFAPA